MNPKQLYSQLYKKFGPQLWWPVTDAGEVKPTYKKRSKLTEKQKLEICIGAILTQNTNWGNVMRAIENLQKANSVGIDAIADAKQHKLAELIKPSGYYNKKAIKLQEFCKYLQQNYNSNLEQFLGKPTAELRAELLSLYGIGNETADNMLCYAAERPVFVVDAYTIQLMERIFGKTDLNYVEAQAFFQSQLPKSSKVLNEMHALIVEFAKQHCRKKPLCGKCFLKSSCKRPPNK